MDRLCCHEVEFASAHPTPSPFSLALAPGELVALSGPSGAGKSTILKLCAGLLPATRGAVTRHGTVSYLAQRATLLPWRTALENVLLPLELLEPASTRRRRSAWTAQAQAARSFLESLSLSPDTRGSVLSGGERQRVLLLRLILEEPEIALLDEPLSAVDRQDRFRFAYSLRAHFKSRRTSAIYVTHDWQEAALFADRIVQIGPVCRLMEDNRVLLDESARQAAASEDLESLDAELLRHRPRRQHPASPLDFALGLGFPCRGDRSLPGHCDAPLSHQSAGAPEAIYRECPKC